MAEKSIFTKILEGEVESEIIYEDKLFFAIKDINPQAPVHVLLIPKKQVATLEELPENDPINRELIPTARKLADTLSIADNYTLLMNVGYKVQQVFHIHFHIMGGWNKPKAK